jgi:hypothetical protein
MNKGLPRDDDLQNEGRGIGLTRDAAILFVWFKMDGFTFLIFDNKSVRSAQHSAFETHMLVG